MDAEKVFSRFFIAKARLLLFSIFQSSYVIETRSAMRFLVPLDAGRFYSPYGYRRLKNWSFSVTLRK